MARAPQEGNNVDPDVRFPIDDDVLDRFVRKVAKSVDPAYDLRALACKAIDALARVREEDVRTRVRHLRVVSDKATGVERELFHTT